MGRSTSSSLQGEQDTISGSCALRHRLVDNCTNSRLILMLMEYYFLTDTNAEAECKCPMIRCQRLHKNARDMLSHLKTCPHLQEGEYWCPCCSQCRSYLVASRKECSWKHTKSTLPQKIGDFAHRLAPSKMKSRSPGRIVTGSSSEISLTSSINRYASSYATGTKANSESHASDVEKLPIAPRETQGTEISELHDWCAASELSDHASHPQQPQKAASIDSLGYSELQDVTLHLSMQQPVQQHMRQSVEMQHSTYSSFPGSTAPITVATPGDAVDDYQVSHPSVTMPRRPSPASLYSEMAVDGQYDAGDNIARPRSPPVPGDHDCVSMLSTEPQSATTQMAGISSPASEQAILTFDDSGTFYRELINGLGPDPNVIGKGPMATYVGLPTPISAISNPEPGFDRYLSCDENQGTADSESYTALQPEPTTSSDAFPDNDTMTRPQSFQLWDNPMDEFSGWSTLEAVPEETPLLCHSLPILAPQTPIAPAPTTPSQGGGTATIYCEYCGDAWTYYEDEPNTRIRAQDNMRRHTRRVHQSQKFYCPTCSASFTRRDNMNKHSKTAHTSGIVKPSTSRRVGPRRVRLIDKISRLVGGGRDLMKQSHCS